MNSEATTLNQNSEGWLFFVKVSFALSVIAMGIGIFFLPTPIWVKGYMAMGTLFTIGSTFTLSKTIRDEFEARKIIHRLSEAKTEKMLKDFENN